MALKRSWAGLCNSQHVEHRFNLTGALLAVERHQPTQNLWVSGQQRHKYTFLSKFSRSGSLECGSLSPRAVQCSALRSMGGVRIWQNSIGRRIAFQRSYATVVEKTAVVAEDGNENQVFNFSSGKFGFQADGMRSCTHVDSVIARILIHK